MGPLYIETTISSVNITSIDYDVMYFEIGLLGVTGFIVIVFLILFLIKNIVKWYIGKRNAEIFKEHLKNILINISDTDEKECSICLNDAQSNNSNTYQETTYILINQNEQHSNIYCKLKTCNHIFHVKCITQWFQQQLQYTCPNCRCVYK